ncbi:MAG: GntR family transcriptional regulator [Clostridia bacterium]|nr:GntR family transcriptional regulator [Clostridia bacterium]
MEQYFEVDATLEIPIYRQLVDKIRAAVRKGELMSGDQLPTVQELADRLGVAKGTIKRAYDELGNMGILEKVQGRGTFICYQPVNSGSRKEQAMAAIEELLIKLEELGFSQTEINIFLNLKLRERSEQLSAVKVAVLECNPENLSQLCEQLRQGSGIELYSYLLDNVSRYPYNLDEDMDLVITTAVHAQQLLKVLPDAEKMAKVAVRLTEDTVTGLIRIKPGSKVGVLTVSQRFGELLQEALSHYNPQSIGQTPAILDASLNAEDYIRDKDVVLVPFGYEKYCDPKAARAMEASGKLLMCGYEMDTGSAMYLKERLERLKRAKEL